MFTLRRLLTNRKNKDEPEDRPGALYKIKFSDCQASFTSETGRNLTTRVNEHKRATKKGDPNNNIAEHHFRIGLSYVRYPQYPLLSTNYIRKLVY